MTVGKLHRAVLVVTATVSAWFSVSVAQTWLPDACLSTAEMIGTTPPVVWMSCPAGDGDALDEPDVAFIEVFVRDAVGLPITGYPASNVRVITCPDGGSVHYCIGCEFTCMADSATGTNGRTTISDLRLLAGGCGDGLRVLLQFVPILDPASDCTTELCLPVFLRSPDIDGSGEVNLADLSIFAASYPPNPYDACSDLDMDGSVYLIDLAIFAMHFGPPGHRCEEVP